MNPTHPLQRSGRRLLSSLFVVATATAAFTQAPATPVWSGWVQCQVVVQGPGYTSRQIHTWEITGAPTVAGAIAEYPATWTVVGDATIDTTDPQRSIRGTRRTEGSVPGARIGIFTRTSDNRLVVLLRSSQLSVAGGTTGTQQITSIGSSQPTTQQVTSAVFEWRPLPVIEDVTTSTHLTGQGSVPVSTRLDPLQPASATGQAVCTWDFVRGGQASPLPRDGVAALGARGPTPQVGSVSTATTVSATGTPSTQPRVAPAATSGIAERAPTRPGTPHNITLAGFNAEGPTPIQPRTISLAGFTAQGGPTLAVAASLGAPRTISLVGFTAEGPNPVAPHNITLTGWTGTGP
jgi:hypothetical protein